VQALGEGFSLEVRVHQPAEPLGLTLAEGA